MSIAFYLTLNLKAVIRKNNAPHHMDLSLNMTNSTFRNTNGFIKRNDN